MDVSDILYFKYQKINLSVGANPHWIKAFVDLKEWNILKKCPYELQKYKLISIGSVSEKLLTMHLVLLHLSMLREKHILSLFKQSKWLYNESQSNEIMTKGVYTDNNTDGFLMLVCTKCITVKCLVGQLLNMLHCYFAFSVTTILFLCKSKNTKDIYSAASKKKKKCI